MAAGMVMRSPVDVAGNAAVEGNAVVVVVVVVVVVAVGENAADEA